MLFFTFGVFAVAPVVVLFRILVDGCASCPSLCYASAKLNL